MTAEQELFTRMSARGCETPEIIKALWGVDKAKEPEKFHNLECKLTRWKKHPKFMEVWMDEVKKAVSLKLMAKGLKRVLEQLDSNEPWLVNKAANDAINFAKTRLFTEEDNKVVIEFSNGSGMPEIGTPDQDEE